MTSTVKQANLEYFIRLTLKARVEARYEQNFYQCPAPFSNYSVSKSGMVYSRKFNRILTQRVNNCGYKIVNITCDNGRKMCTGVHRLVALTFLENKHAYRDVGHKNDDKLDNNVANLEWLPHKANLNKAHRLQLMKTAGGHGRSIRKVNDDGTFQEYKSIKSAAEANGLSNTSVSGSASGTLHINKPYHFIFVR